MPKPFHVLYRILLLPALAMIADTARGLPFTWRGVGLPAGGEVFDAGAAAGPAKTAHPPGTGPAPHRPGASRARRGPE
ncbi:hypothetical protein AB0P12_15905 [Streptomyces subrutilus]|uniref:hypothetical protein n=1 Tax=Streptomyces subrutilus TaxID=36818 RepID=UPI00341AD62E